MNTTDARRSIISTLICLFALTQALQGQTNYYVSPCGDDAWTGTSPACAAPDGPKSTIQAAINATINGDSVVVADGAYSGLGNRDLDYGGKAISVRSENGAAACIIDCMATDLDPHRAFHFHSGETASSVLDGLTIRNGVMPSGGGILCEANSAPLIRNCVLSDNTANPVTANEGGGGLCNLNSSPTVINCEFLRNRVNVTVDLTGGGGMENAGSSPTVTDCVFRENEVIGAAGPTAYGSGGMGNVSSSSPIVTRCQFIANTTTDEGGAMVCYSDSHPQLTDCAFEGNIASQAAGAMEVLVNSSPLLVRCTFIGNRTLDAGAAGGFGAGGMHIDINSNPTLIDCGFIENDSAEDSGAAQAKNFSHPKFINCSFLGNTAVGVGGAIAFAGDCNPELTNCAFSGNNAGSAGGAVYNQINCICTLTNCTFSANAAGGAGGGALRNAASTARATLKSCVAWGNTPNQITNSLGAVATVSYSDVQGGFIGTGNINGDPLFVDANGPDNVVGTADDDLHLSAGSPCIETGDPALLPSAADLDMDGQIRVWDGDMNGTARVDMGADEFESHVVGDPNCDGLLNGLDAQAFVLAMFDPPLYDATYSNCATILADVNADGTVDLADVPEFVDELLGL